MATWAFGPIDGSLYVWNVERLWELAGKLPVRTVPVNSIRCLDEVHWFGGLNGFGGLTGTEPTCRRVADHAKRIYAAQFDRPIILSATGHVMDGMHRLAKAWVLGLPEIQAVQFAQDPEPDEVRPMPAVFHAANAPPEPRPADDAKYSEGLFAYYDHPDNHVHLNGAAKMAREYDRQVAQPGHWRREVVHAQRRALRGRRVLEVACGTGVWTRYLADVTEHVLATDASPRMLARARRLARTAKRFPRGRLRFLRLDAYALANAPGKFDGALAMNWFEHVPRARHDEFLDALHNKLGRGARVFIGMIHLSDEWRAQLYTKPGGADLYGVRQQPDGSQYEIIDNVFAEDELRRVFAPRSKRLNVTWGKAHYWVSYETT
ncbi:MAG TPA: methyltransferase domain-containing protein [Gemmataceae bacterium]|jgi:2-polyprenyl-3-methyl-5-hydroxy-6-metoxy-1,4-benzoquinol methylase|nr:methyltransferase domain-containing protein [Gemmataceae bacterium]